MPLDAVAVADLAEARGDHTRIRRKSLGNFVKKLEQSGHVKLAAQLAGVGGSRTAFELLQPALAITEEQLRQLLAQSEAGLDLSTLLPLAEVYSPRLALEHQKRLVASVNSLRFISA